MRLPSSASLASYFYGVVGHTLAQLYDKFCHYMSQTTTHSARLSIAFGHCRITCDALCTDPCCAPDQALWYESGQLRDYAVFAAGAVVTAAWFLHHHFWFLQVRAVHACM